MVASATYMLGGDLSPTLLGAGIDQESKGMWQAQLGGSLGIEGLGHQDLGTHSVVGSWIKAILEKEIVNFSDDKQIDLF